MLKIKKMGKDYTKYSFLGEQYGKSALVHAVVKNYSEEHPEVNAKKLNLLFTRKETGSTFDMVTPVGTAAEGRFLMNVDDVIKAAGRKVVVTNQWSKNNIKTFIAFANNILHMRIERSRHVLAHA